MNITITPENAAAVMSYAVAVQRMAAVVARGPERFGDEPGDYAKARAALAKARDVLIAVDQAERRKALLLRIMTAKMQAIDKGLDPVRVRVTQEQADLLSTGGSGRITVVCGMRVMET